jgi:hypothetical protein
LFHRCFADQERARDFLHRQAGDDTQRQGDLLSRGQIGMTADEQQPEHVVSVVCAVESIGHGGLGIVRIGQNFLIRQRLLLAAAARLVEREIAPDQNQPGRRIAWRSIDRPLLQGAQARFLKRLLGGFQIAEVAQQRRDGLWPCRGHCRIYPAQVTHENSLTA